MAGPTPTLVLIDHDAKGNKPVTALSADASTKPPPSASATERPVYPGSEATVEQFIDLADEYLAAAHSLLSLGSRRSSASSAPARLCAIHAVEMYLNAFLVFHGVSHKQVRGLQHDLAQRTAIATEKGLRLRIKTQAHLLRIHDQRDYLVVRYAPDQVGGLSELNRMFATLTEIGTKVRIALPKHPQNHRSPSAISGKSTEPCNFDRGQPVGFE